jgi:PAS domain S-box-containing protein
VTLSRKRAKSRTRGRKLRSVEAKARIGRARKSRADLEQQLKACRRQIAQARERLADATLQQTATSEMLRLISNAPIQSVLDAVAEHAARLCDASNARIWRQEDNLLRLVASYGESSATMDGREGLPVNRDTVTGRAACDRRTFHVHDIAAEDSEYPLGSRLVKGQGWHTTLATPLLREGTPIGTILVRRTEVRPFSDKQIALLETFADQAAIAIENVRLFEAEKQRTLALAHANRDLAEREAKIRRLVDSNIIGIFIWDFDGRILDANDAFLRMVNYDREDLISGRIRWTELTPSDWRNRNNLRIETQKSSGHFPPFEKEYTRKDGTRVPVLMGGAIFEEGGNQGMAYVLDLTEPKRAEGALRESEYKLRQIIETVPSLLWSTGPDGEPTHVSQRVLDYSGMRLEDFKRGGWEAFVHPADFPETVKAFEHAIATGTSYEAVHRLRRAVDGEYRWHHARGEPLRDREGRIIQWYGLSIDIDERKKAEDRLRRSEAYLAEAQRLSHTGTSVFNKTTVLYWSEETYRMWGFDPLQGVPSREAVRQRMHPDDWDRVEENIERGVREKKSVANEFRIILPDGTVKHVEATNFPVFSASGELLEIFGTGVDVTERKQAEQALRGSEAKIRRLVDANIIGIFIWDLDGRIVEANDAFLRLVGYDREDIVSGRMRWAELTPPEWFVTHEGRLAELKVTGSLWPYEKEYFRKDGSRVPVLTGGATFEEGGSQGVAFVLDLTERKRAEQILRDSERNARSAIDGIDGLVAIMAPSGELDAINRQVIEYFGRSLEEMKNWGTSDTVHPEDLPRIAEIFQRSLAAGTPFHYELRLRRFDGEYRWFENRGVPIRETSGRIVRWYILGTDIEDRTRALARLEQMQSDFAHMNRVSMMGELAASLSHEITQPIASARNNARAAQNFLDRQPPDLSEVREALSCVVGDTDRAGDIVDRIRANIKKTPPRKEHFDLNEAINEVLVLAQSAITENEVSVRTRFAEGPLAAYGDRVQLQQVILNLVLNAVEAMASVEAPARLLLISTEQNRTNEVLVTIRDSGPGIEPDHLERVFEAFYTTKSNGVGMGLSICRSIISAQGGRLWAETKKPPGAVFLFTLPAVQAGA